MCQFISESNRGNQWWCPWQKLDGFHLCSPHASHNSICGGYTTYMMNGQRNDWLAWLPLHWPFKWICITLHHMKLLVGTSPCEVFAQGICVCCSCCLVYSSTNSLPSLSQLVIWIPAQMYFPQRGYPWLLFSITCSVLFYQSPCFIICRSLST